MTSGLQEDGQAPQAEDVEISPAGEINLFAVAVVQRRHLRRTVKIGVAAFCLVLIWMLVAKPLYKATATVLIPQQRSLSAASAALQAVSGLDMSGSSYEVYLDILRSRTVADAVIGGNDLKRIYRAKTQVDAEKALAAATTLEGLKDGVIRVTVESHDAALSARIANSYIEQLDRLNQSLAISSASQQRVYFERQMVREKDALADAEVALKSAQEKSGVLVPTAQVQAAITAMETTRAQLRVHEIQLNGLLQSETERNPQVITLRAEVAGLERQLQAMQSGAGGSDTGLSAAKAPEASLVYTRLAREVKYHETLFELLARQYESAREQESKDVSILQVLDRALPAERKSWPPRALYCLLGLLGGLFAGMLYTAFESFTEVILRNPSNRRRYRDLIANREIRVSEQHAGSAAQDRQ